VTKERIELHEKCAVACPMKSTNNRKV